MSLENEIVPRSYDAFRRGDVETALAPIGEAFVLEDSTRVPASRIVELELARIPEPSLPGTPTDTKSEYVGREGFMEWLGEWLSAFEDWQFVVDRVLYQQTQLLVLGRVRGRGKGSGVLVENHFGHLWSFRDGEPTRMLYFNDWSEALEAFGLRE
jgi:ketosteroid isomerase-like protein